MRCYHPSYAHGTCPAGHPVHLDVDHYETPMWVHCTILDVVQCPADLEDVSGASAGYAGKHRAS